MAALTGFFYVKERYGRFAEAEKTSRNNEVKVMRGSIQCTIKLN